MDHQPDDEAEAIAAADGGHSMTEAQHEAFDRVADAVPDRLFGSAWIGDRLRVYVKDWPHGSAWDSDELEVRTCPRSMDDLEAAQDAAQPVYELLFGSGALDHVRLEAPEGVGVWRMQLRREPTPAEAREIAALTGTGFFEVVVDEGSWTEFRFD